MLISRAVVPVEERRTILQLFAPAQFGGLERVVHDLAIGLARRGHHLHVAAILPDINRVNRDTALLGSIQREGVQLHRISVPPRNYRLEREHVREICSRIEPDVVHTHGYRPDVLDSGVALRAGIPTVSTVHGFTRGGWKNRFYESLQRRAYRQFTAVAAVSRSQVEELIHAGVPPHKVHLVPNAWTPGPEPLTRDDARQQLNAVTGTFHLGWVGRLSPEKGAEILIDALAQLSDLPLNLSIIGAGSEEARLRQRAERRNVQGRIHWHGFVEDASRYLSAFDLFVLSSHTEGTPLALLEAMAARVPIVATSVGGVPDVLSTSEGVLVPPGDPTALAAAIREVYERPTNARKRAVLASNSISANFCSDGWLSRYEAIYQSVVQHTFHA